MYIYHIPIVVMTVPAKKKALPRSQWLLLLEEFPTGLTPALVAFMTRCKEMDSKISQLIALLSKYSTTGEKVD